MQTIKIHKALSDPNRLRIIRMLEVKPLCVCEIKTVLDLATSTVSKHLSLLKDAGFIKEEKDGKWVNYMLNYEFYDGRVTKIIENLNYWIPVDEQIKLDVKAVKKVDRINVCGK